MRKSTAQFLKRACSHIAQETGGSTDGWDEGIEAEISSLLDETAGFQRQARSLVEAKLQPWLTAFDVALLAMSDLTLLAIELASGSRPALWPELEAASPGSTKPSWFLQMLMTNLTNTLLAMRTLICAGLDYQARVLFRSHVELADATLVAVHDVEFFLHLSAASPTFDDARKIWQKHLRPSAVRQRVRRILGELGVSDNDRRLFLNALDDRYTWLSQWSHNNIIPLSMGFLPRAIGSQQCALGLGGRATAASEGTLEAALEHTVFFLHLLTSLLHLQQGWTFHRERCAILLRSLALLPVTLALLRKELERISLFPSVGRSGELSDDERELLRAYRRMDEQWRWSWRIALGRLVLFQNDPELQAMPPPGRLLTAHRFLCTTMLRLQGVNVRHHGTGKPFVDQGELADFLQAKSERDKRLIEHFVRQLEEGPVEADSN